MRTQTCLQCKEEFNWIYDHQEGIECPHCNAYYRVLRKYVGDGDYHIYTEWIAHILTPIIGDLTVILTRVSGLNVANVGRLQHIEKPLKLALEDMKKLVGLGVYIRPDGVDHDSES